MMATVATITPFEPHHQPEIDELFALIAEEFPVPIYSQHSTPIVERARQGNNSYWVALHNGSVVGTVGVMVLSEANAALKSMFVHQHFRGKGLAAALHQTAVEWAKDNGASTMYLGTMAQFSAAHRFYEKLGYEAISPNELPEDFPANSVDTLFYFKHLDRG